MCCKSVIGSCTSCTPTSSSSTGLFVPAFGGTEAASTYTVQIGSYTKTTKWINYNFKIKVTAYAVGGSTGTIDLTLPFATTGSLTTQFVNIVCYQGVSPGIFSTHTCFASINPSSTTLTISTNFSLNAGDEWYANFSLNLA